jgi:hypothetical protein
MGMMIVRHKVKDYGQWRPIFDGHARRRRLGGKARKVAARRRRESWPSYIPRRPAVSLDLHDAADYGASTEAYRASCGCRKTQKGAQRALGPPRGPSPYHTPEGAEVGSPESCLA